MIFALRLLSILAILLVGTNLAAMTVDVPAAGKELISVGDEWRFFRGKTAPSDSPEAWKEVDFDDSEWEVGESGFGYGDDDDETVLGDMRGSYVSVYIRKEFTVSAPIDDGIIQLVIDYDDGFIAYLNGNQVYSRHMPGGPATFETEATSHEAGSPETINLGKAGDLLREGKNVLAIEGHNTDIDSTDFSLIPSLRITTDIVKDGETWIVGTQTLTLAGTAPIPQTVLVKINDTEADFNAADGTWQGEIWLWPGENDITVLALDAEMTVVDTGTAEILYVPPWRRVAGELTEDTLWTMTSLWQGHRSVYVVEEAVVVQPGVALRIGAGTTVMLRDSASLVVFGQLLADGTDEQPIIFTHYGDGTTWGSIVLDGAEDSRLLYCTIEYSSSATSYGGKDYIGAVSTVACHLDVDGCTLHKLPEESPTAEGDGIDLSGGATGHVNNSRFLGLGEGVHTDQSYVLVENSLFTDIRGDNDGVDMDGESDPVPIVRNNLFIGSADDTVHADRCSAIITGNVVTGCGDHGIVLRNKCTPYLANNVVYNCRSAGIAIENQCDALLVNNTIYDCGRGLRLFHLERPGADPGGGIGTARNCIIWDCPQPITLADESTVTVTYSNVNGTNVWEGEGNINADPMFLDAENGDFHLTKFSPCIDAGVEDDAPADDFDGCSRPRGSGFDMGAFESPYWPFVDTDDDGMADGWEMHHFASLEHGSDDDSDGDGVNNLAEYDSGLGPTNRDTDDDGLADGWERAYGFDPLIPTGDDGPLADPDGDGFDNLAEHTAGTNPTDGNSRFEIAEVIAQVGTVSLRWQARAGREYRVLASADQETWTEVETIPPADERQTEWFDPNPREEPRRFYKLKVIFSYPPPP